jgi:O-antigen ligase
MQVFARLVRQGFAGPPPGGTVTGMTSSLPRASAPAPQLLALPAPVAGGAIAVLVALLGIAHGGYAAQDWLPLAPIVAVALLALVVTGPARWTSIGAGGLVALVALALLAAWTATGLVVASDRSAVWEEVVRCATYALLLGVVALAASSERVRRGIAAGVACGATVVAIVALAQAWRDPATHMLYGRLLGPVGYQNALAALLALPMLPLVAVASMPRTRGWRRGIALAALVVLASVAVLPLSRGAALAGVAATCWYLAAAPRRLRSCLAMLVPASTILVGWRTLTAPYDGALQGAQLQASAHRIVLFIACASVIAFVVGVVWSALDEVVVVPRSLTRIVGAVLLAAVLLATAGACVELLQRTHGPSGLRRTVVAHFRSDPATAASERASISNNGRLPLWSVAIRDVREHPWTGVGAGNWASTYYRHRSRDVGFVRQPHSLALELLAERGIPALVAFVAFAAALATCAIRRVRLGSRDSRAFAAASAGAVAWVLMHAQLEWFWQFPVVLVPLLALAGTLVAPIESRPAARGPRRRGRGVARAADAPVAAATLLVLSTPLVLAEHDVSAASRARSDDAAIAQLYAARRWNPLDPTIERQLAVRLDAVGRPAQAAEAVRRQLQLDHASWVSWVLAARRAALLGHTAAARRYAIQAQRRNPLEPSLRDPARIGASDVLADPVTRDAQRAA